MEQNHKVNLNTSFQFQKAAASTYKGQNARFQALVLEDDSNSTPVAQKRNLFQIINGVDSRTGQIRIDEHGIPKTPYKQQDFAHNKHVKTAIDLAVYREKPDNSRKVKIQVETNENKAQSLQRKATAKLSGFNSTASTRTLARRKLTKKKESMLQLLQKKRTSKFSVVNSEGSQSNSSISDDSLTESFGSQFHNRMEKQEGNARSVKQSPKQSPVLSQENS